MLRCIALKINESVSIEAMNSWYIRHRSWLWCTITSNFLNETVWFHKLYPAFFYCGKGIVCCWWKRYLIICLIRSEYLVTIFYWYSLKISFQTHFCGLSKYNIVWEIIAVKRVLFRGIKNCSRKGGGSEICFKFQTNFFNYT